MKHGLSLLVISLIFCTLQGWAADQSAKPAPTMGRLFFSPNDRASLDNIRQNSKAPDKLIKADEPEKEEHSIDVEAEPSKRIIVKGYVSRTDGKNTVWVNDKAMVENSSSKDVSVGKLQKNSGQVQITVNSNDKKTIILKAGQIYDPNSNKIYNHLKDIPGTSDDEEPKTILDNLSEKLGAEKLKEKFNQFISKLTDQKPTEERTP